MNTLAPIAEIERHAERVCFHCGLPIDPQTVETVVLDGREVEVCCVGCAGAVELIGDAGLTSYYARREARTGIRARTDSDLDRSGASDRFVVRSAEGASADIAIDGLRCAACAWVIEQGLEALDGVLAVNVELAASRAHLRWDPAEIDLEGLLARVRELGFDAAPARAGEEERLLERQRRRSLRALGISGVVAMQVMMLAVADYAGLLGDGIDAGYRAVIVWAQMVLASVAIGYGAGSFFSGALRALKARSLTMDVPVALAISLAWGASVWPMFSGAAAEGAHLYFDSVCMFVFLLLVGRHMELGIRHRFVRGDAHLGALLPSVAQRIDAPGATARAVAADGLSVGDLVRVRAGEIAPADGRIVTGRGALDRSAITGESAPVAVGPGDQVDAGSRVLDAVLEFEVLRAPSASAVAGIPALLERARGQRPRAARLADLLASRFLAGVLALAAVAGAIWMQIDPSRALEVVLATLIVTCPCALSLATPSAITAASIRLRRAGVLVADPDTFETLAQCDAVCFDKTGTLTEPLAVEVRRVHGGADADRIVAALERDVDHPLARVLANLVADAPRAQDVRFASGNGVEGVVDGERYRFGRASWCGASTDHAAQLVLVRDRDGRCLARYEIAERLRPGARDVLARLSALGLETLLLSGDSAARTARIAHTLGIEHWAGDARPDDKLAWLRARMRGDRHVLYVGDGINDAPVLGGASASVAVGTASDYARSAADAVLLDDDLDALPTLVSIARRTRTRIRTNLAWALGYNAVAVPLAVAGVVTPWLAAIGMSVSSIVVMLGSASLLREDAD